MKGQKTPSRKRPAKCPQCGLYFAPAGLNGHMRFYHKMGMGQEKQDLLDKSNDLIVMTRRFKLLDYVGRDPGGALLTKEAVDGALQLLLFEYLFEHGIFKKK